MTDSTDNPSPTLSVKTLQQMRLRHESTKPAGEHGQCLHCMIPGWPCDQSIILDMAISVAAKDARIADLERDYERLEHEWIGRGALLGEATEAMREANQKFARQAEQLEQMRSRIVTAQGGIFEDIAKERERQEQLLVERGWKWSMATPGIDHALKLMPLMEEVGEVAHAVRVAEGFAVAGNSHENHGLYAELKQVAACAVAWMEALNAEENDRAALSPNEPVPEGKTK